MVQLVVCRHCTTLVVPTDSQVVLVGKEASLVRLISSTINQRLSKAASSKVDRLTNTTRVALRPVVTSSLEDSISWEDHLRLDSVVEMVVDTMDQAVDQEASCHLLWAHHNMASHPTSSNNSDNSQAIDRYIILFRNE